MPDSTGQYIDRWEYAEEKDMFRLKQIVKDQGFDWVLEQLAEICDDLQVEQPFIEHYYRRMKQMILRIGRRTVDTTDKLGA